MLQVGNFMFQDNMNAMEMKTHFALWCIMAAPLILGHDLSDWQPPAGMKGMTAKEFVEVVGNKEVRASAVDDLLMTACASPLWATGHRRGSGCPRRARQEC
jgi:hypothetical protein